MLDHENGVGDGGFLLIGVPRTAPAAVEPDAACGLVTRWYETKQAAVAAAQAFITASPTFQAYVVKAEANFFHPPQRVAGPGRSAMEPVTYFKRFRMEARLTRPLPAADLPPGFSWLAWSPDLADAHALAKFRGFAGEPDALLFPSLARLGGCQAARPRDRRPARLLPGRHLARHAPRRARPEPCQGIAERRAGAIQNLAVAPTYRGLGLGAALLARASKGSRPPASDRAALEVTAANAAAVALYRRAGFRSLQTLYKPVPVTPPDVSRTYPPRDPPPDAEPCPTPPPPPHLRQRLDAAGRADAPRPQRDLRADDARRDDPRGPHQARRRLGDRRADHPRGRRPRQPGADARARQPRHRPRRERRPVQPASSAAGTLARNVPAALGIYADIVRRPHLPDDELDPSSELRPQDILGLEDSPQEGDAGAEEAVLPRPLRPQPLRRRRRPSRR